MKRIDFLSKSFDFHFLVYILINKKYIYNIHNVFENNVISFPIL